MDRHQKHIGCGAARKAARADGGSFRGRVRVLNFTRDGGEEEN